jgi:hypothetical protein
MAELYVKCPKDPEIRYQREVCEKIFRKGNHRLWCKTCAVFQDEKKETDKS